MLLLPLIGPPTLDDIGRCVVDWCDTGITGTVHITCAQHGLVGTIETAIYTASKGGVSLLTRSLGLELAPRGVRVNAVCPNDVDTPMLAGQARDFGGDDPDGYLAALLANYPQKERSRFIRPEEIAALIFYLASPEAAPITGACIPIDFGSTAGY